MAKPLSRTPIADGLMSPAEADKIIARVVIEEAKRGNPEPLICRLKSDQLTEIERDYIAKAWPRHGKRGHDYVREVRDALICMQVERLISEGEKTEAAVKQVAQDRGLKRSSVFEILRKSNLDK
jgi:hypothetical protein